MKVLARVLIVLCLLPAGLSAQKYITKAGHMRIFSTTPIENIEAINKQVNCALDIATGDLVFKVLMKSFDFEKALMQEHFNENYVESDKYPNAMFKGRVVNLKDVNFAKPGVYNVTIEGDLTMHGVTKKVSEKGTFEVKGDKIEGKAKFFVKLGDYNIKIPGAVSKQINESQEITVDVVLEKLSK